MKEWCALAITELLTIYDVYTPQAKHLTTALLRKPVSLVLTLYSDLCHHYQIHIVTVAHHFHEEEVERPVEVRQPWLAEQIRNSIPLTHIFAT